MLNLASGLLSGLGVGHVEYARNFSITFYTALIPGEEERLSKSLGDAGWRGVGWSIEPMGVVGLVLNPKAQWV